MAEQGQILITRVGLQIPDGLPFDTWERAGRRIADVLDSSAWCVGDWVEHGNQKFRGKYREVIDRVGLEYQTVRNYAWVARQFPFERRRAGLSFQHHAEAAGLPEAEREIWLDRAEEHGWTRNELRRHLRDARNGELPPAQTVVLPRIAAQQERLKRWQAAAAESTQSLERWIVQCLDNAAARALTSHQEPPDQAMPSGQPVLVTTGAADQDAF